MNIFDDKLSTTEQAQSEPVRQDPENQPDAAVVELGKVSDTRGGWIGAKLDTGFGNIPY